MAMGTKLNDFIPFISEKTAKLILTLFRLVAISGLGYWLWSSIQKQTHIFLKWALALIFAGDALSTMVVDGRQLKVYAWYDNEWGYSCRMADLVCHVVDMEQGQK